MRALMIQRGGRTFRCPTYRQLGVVAAEVGLDAAGLADHLPSHMRQATREAWASEVLKGRHPYTGNNATHLDDFVPWFPIAKEFTAWLSQGYGKRFQPQQKKVEELL